jgi:hypothetical protein
MTLSVMTRNQYPSGWIKDQAFQWSPLNELYLKARYSRKGKPHTLTNLNIAYLGKDCGMNLYTATV